MNRITGQMAFFDGGKWNLMPILRVEMLSPSDVIPPPDSPQNVSALPTQKALGTRTAENPAPQARPEGLQRTVPAVEKESAGKELPVFGQERPFAIQIRAIRDGEKAKAILNELKQGGLDGHLEAVTIKGQGTWYRIFVGRFATKEEAMKHLNAGLLSSQYPGSFVQKINR
jgi:cell division septation protein DedD